MARRIFLPLRFGGGITLGNPQIREGKIEPLNQIIKCTNFQTNTLHPTKNFLYTTPEKNTTLRLLW